LRTLYINEYIDVTGYGASCPVIVKADDDSTYVLKTRYQSNLNLDEDEHARRLFDCSIYIETLSYLLLQAFGFEHIAEIVYLNIDDDAIEDAEHRFNDLDNEREQMALENIRNSKGLNLGIKWIEDSEGSFSEVISIPKNFCEATINYDAYFLNPDRDKSNPNILFSKSMNKYFLIDFGNAFDHLFVMDDLYAPDAMLRMSSWYDKYIFDMHYLLFDEIEDVTKYRKKFSKNEILEIVDTLPEEWEPNRIKEEIATVLSERIGNRRIFENA